MEPHLRQKDRCPDKSRFRKLHRICKTWSQSALQFTGEPVERQATQSVFFLGSSLKFLTLRVLHRTWPHLSRTLYSQIMPVETSAARGEKYLCPVCKMELFSAAALTKHIRSHNSTAASPASINSCTICGKVLSSQSSLDRHMLVHSGESLEIDRVGFATESFRRVVWIIRLQFGTFFGFNEKKSFSKQFRNVDSEER